MWTSLGPLVDYDTRSCSEWTGRQGSLQMTPVVGTSWKKGYSKGLDLSPIAHASDSDTILRSRSFISGHLPRLLPDLDALLPADRSRWIRSQVDKRRLHTHIFGATVAHVEPPVMLPSGGTESHLQLNVYSRRIRKSPVDGALESSGQSSCCTGLVPHRCCDNDDHGRSFVEPFLTPILHSAHCVTPGAVGSDVESERNRA